MKTILKTYEVTYIFGTINPEERKIKIQTINQLTEAFIREEIVRLRPNQQRFIGDILSVFLIEQKEIGNDEIEDKPNNPKEIPVFNW